VGVRGSSLAALLGIFVTAISAAAQEPQDLSTLSRDDVLALQRRLVDAGCFNGPLDGNTGPALSQAIKICPVQQPFLSIETGMHTAPIVGIATDASCRLAATASHDKTVRMWSLPDGRLLRTQRLPIGDGNLGKVYTVAVSSDGKWVAAGGWDAIYAIGDPNKRDGIYLFDSATGTQVRHIGSFGNVLNHIVFSPDNKLIAVTLGGNEGVRIVDIASGREVMSDRQYGAQSYGFAFARDGMMYSVSYDGFLRQYGPDFVLKNKVTLPGGQQPLSVAVDPEGKRLAIGYFDTTAVDIIDAKTLKPIAAADNRNTEYNLGSLAWSPDGQYLYGAGRFRAFLNGAWRHPIRKWTRDGQMVGADVPVSENTVTLANCADAIAFGAQDPAWGMLRTDGTAVTLGLARIPDMRAKRGTAFVVSADGTRLRFGLGIGEDRPVLFDLASGLTEAPGPTPTDLHAPTITGINIAKWEGEFNPTLDGKPLGIDQYELSRSLTIRPDRTGFLLGTEFRIRAYTVEGKLRWSQQAPSLTFGVNMARDGEIAIAAYGDGTIRWYRWSDGKPLLALFVHKDDKRWVAWTPTGYYMASPGAEDLIGWHVNRGWEQQADFFPVARFRNQFNRPDIVRLVLQTLDEGAAVRQANATSRRAEQTTTILAQLPPVIRLKDYDNGGTYSFSSENLSLDYELRSPSGKAVDRIDVMVDGRPQQAVGLSMRSADSAQVRTDKINVTFPKHDVDVALIAWSGEIASEPARFKLKWTGQQESDLLKPKLYALVVGVSDYVEPDLKLAYAAKDAGDFGKVLQAQAGGMYGTVTVKLLTDTKVTRDSIVEGLAWLEQQVTSRDIGIVFLAGHGVNDEKLNYWYLPYDASLANLRTRGVVQDDIRRTLRNLAGKAILFLDTCHAGQVMKVATRSADTDQTAMINDFIKAENGVIVFASSQGKEVSVELKDVQNGAFTKALIEGIGDGKANLLNKGNITPSQLDAFVVERVKELTHGTQHPVMSKPDTVPDFPFAIVRK